MSPNIAIRTGHFAEAVDFYTKVIGFDNRSEDSELADQYAIQTKDGILTRLTYQSFK
jgi:catechol 2,3-dioxygenase-like lactoylglutathione lyase family enzyme